MDGIPPCTSLSCIDGKTVTWEIYCPECYEARFDKEGEVKL